MVVPRAGASRSQPGAAASKPGDRKDGEEAGPRRTRPSAKEVAYWDEYYQNRPTDSVKFLESLMQLRDSGRMQDVEAALLGYLRHSKDRRAWMYAMLAVTLEHNQAPEDSIKQSLGFAALIARRPDPNGDPESLVTIVDLMARHKWFELDVPAGEGKTSKVAVGDLLDDAAKRLPNRPEPLLRSVDFALLQKDPERMAWAVESLMSLGWPGVDAAWRADARKFAEKLAATLREEDRTGDAETLMGRVSAAEPRDVFARLTWDGPDGVDLDLLVDEPLGATAQATFPRTVFGGAIVQNGRGPEKEEIYTCPRGYSGTYTFRVKAVVNDPDQPVKSAHLEVFTHEGGPAESTQAFEINLDDPQPVPILLEGGRRTEPLPYIVPKVLGIRRRDAGPSNAAPKPPFAPTPSGRRTEPAAPKP